MDDRRQLHIHLRARAELAQHRVERDAIRGRLERRQRRQVIEDDSKIRHLVGDADDRLQQREARIGGVHDEIRLRKELQPVDERRRLDLRRDVSAPQVPATDPTEQRVLAVTLQILRKLRLLGLQIADDPDDDRIQLGHLEHPQVVLDPRARFDLDRPDGPERDGQRAIASRQTRAPVGPRVLGPLYGAPCGRVGSKR